MSLNDILKQIDLQKMPPVDLWNPEYCGDIDIEILRDGQWRHEGDIIHRQRMVELFASVLKKEGENYFLVTPAEKLKITVESTPFIAVSAEYVGNTWVVTNNLGQRQTLNDLNPLTIRDGHDPIMLWRNGLPARIHQNLMYQWQMYALDNQTSEKNATLYLSSGASRFELGKL